MATETTTTAPAEQEQASDAPQHNGAHDHHGPPHLEHHFVSSEQQFSSAKLGMWLFLITEILLFSGMFVAYTVYRAWHPEVFAEASTHLDWMMGGLNTLVLLGSSLTIALAIHYAQKDNQRMLVTNLVITLVLAGVFLVVKYFEYSAKFEHGIYPGEMFDAHGAHYAYLNDIPYVPQFFSIYFVMTGIHGVHVVAGMIIIGWMISRALRGHFSSEWYTPVELTGLYWHLVDIVWIFLFPLLYLV
jgi:cytochrome c oxidase subunit 3